MKKSVMAIAIFIAMMNFVFGDSYDLKQMREYFKSRIPGGPYIYLQSPRTGLGVGTIYKVIKNQTFFFSRPNDCFTKEVLDKVKTDEMAVPQLKISGERSLELGLQVANSGPITDEVKAEFKRKRISSMILKIPSLKRELITILELNKAINNSMDFACKGAMTSTVSENWIILESLHADQFSLEFQDEKGVNAGISAGIIKILFPSYKSQSQKEVTGSINFSDQSHIVAIKALKVSDLDRGKSASSNSEMEVLQPDEYYKIIDQK